MVLILLEDYLIGAIAFGGKSRIAEVMSSPTTMPKNGPAEFPPRQGAGEVQKDYYLDVNPFYMRSAREVGEMQALASDGQHAISWAPISFYIAVEIGSAERSSHHLQSQSRVY